jgi:hypothetical protein
MFWRSALLATALIAGSSGVAQARQDSQLWLGGSVNVKLGGKWRISQEGVVRFSDDRRGLYEAQSGTLLGYSLSPTTTLAAGYIHNLRYSDGKVTATEHRVRAQLTRDKLLTIGKGSVTARLRGEHRWREGVEGSAWRLRPFVRYTVPILGKTKLVLSNETFVNLDTTSYQVQAGVERMRNVVGVTVPLSSKFALDAGYLNQYSFIRRGDDQVDHAASFSLTANF